MLITMSIIAIYATTIEIFGTQVGLLFGTITLFGAVATIKLGEVTGLFKWLEENNG